MYDSILVPVDGSEHSQYAATHAVDLANNIDAEVHFLHVVSLKQARHIEVPRIEQGYLHHDLNTMGEEIIAETISPVDEQDVRVNRSVMTGHPVEEILSCVESQRPDLVIMGSQGKTGLKRMFLGSVAENVARRTTVPILLVHPTDEFVAVLETEQDEKANEK